jgi:hypothetical protein
VAEPGRQSEEPPEEEGSVLERRLRMLANVIAPTTAVGALLFYFGYVSSRAEYEYFGVDVDTIGLGTQDFVMRSPQPLLVPLLVLTLLGISALLLHARTLRRIETAAAAPEDAPPGAAKDSGESEDHLARLACMARRNRGIGLAILGIGIAMLFLYALVGSWTFYALATPLLIAIGALLAAYYAHVLDLVKQRAAHPKPTPRRKKHTPAAPYTVPLRAATILRYVVIAASVFWATATVAQWTGRGLARHQAHDLDRLPTVILDTKERLYLHSPGIDEAVLPVSTGQTFHYRYRNLRLLIEGHDRLFLVPATWSASDSTMVVPFDGSARVQFLFVNEKP